MGVKKSPKFRRFEDLTMTFYVLTMTFYVPTMTFYVLTMTLDKQGHIYYNMTNISQRSYNGTNKPYGTQLF